MPHRQLQGRIVPQAGWLYLLIDIGAGPAGTFRVEFDRGDDCRDRLEVPIGADAYRAAFELRTSDLPGRSDRLRCRLFWNGERIDTLEALRPAAVDAQGRFRVPAAGTPGAPTALRYRNTLADLIRRGEGN